MTRDQRRADTLLRKIPLPQFWEAQRILILQLVTLGVPLEEIARRLDMGVGVVVRVLAVCGIEPLRTKVTP